MVNDSFSYGVRNFHGISAGERLQFCFHQHWIRLIRPTFVALLWSLVGLYLIFGNLRASFPTSGSRHMIIMAVCACFLFFQLRWTMRLYRAFLYVIAVTDKRVHRIKRTLLAVDDHQSIELFALQDIQRLQHGVFQNMMGFGTLLLVAPETELRIHFTPHIADMHAAISRLHEVLRAQTLRPNSQSQNQQTSLGVQPTPTETNTVNA